MKILIVEDEIKVAKYLKKGLELTSHIVDTVDNGQDGYDYAVSNEYDLIILDRMLPLMSGVDLCKKLRNEKIITPILMLTAKTQVNDRVEGLNAGADDYLGKPFAFEELLARIAALSRRPKTIKNQVINEEGLEINMRNYEVKRNGKTIKLSRKEYALLLFLIKNKNQVVSAIQIIENVWNYESEVLPNTAQVYIGYLRKKIDINFPKEVQLIHTIRGFGYRFGKGNDV